MSLAATVAGPLAGTVLKAVLARKNVRTPLLLDCLEIVAVLRQGTPVGINALVEEAEQLADVLREVDDEDNAKAVLDSVAEGSVGGEE